MDTMTIKISDSANIRNIAVAVRQLKGVAEVQIHREAKFECIPGLAYTRKDMIAEVAMAEEDYKMGRTITSEELTKRMATW